MVRFADGISTLVACVTHFFKPGVNGGKSRSELYTHLDKAVISQLKVWLIGFKLEVLKTQFRADLKTNKGGTESHT